MKIVLLIVLCLILSGCGGDSTKSEIEQHISEVSDGGTYRCHKTTEKLRNNVLYECVNSDDQWTGEWYKSWVDGGIYSDSFSDTGE